MDKKKFGSRLRELRRASGLTQEQLAERLDVSNRSVSRWETGANLPDLDTLIALADMFSVELGELLGGEIAPKVAEYSGERERALARRASLIALAGSLAWGASLVTMLQFLENVTGAWIVPAMSLCCLALYAAATIAPRHGRTASGYLNCMTGAFAAIAASGMALLAVFFRGGDYRNLGLAGVYICASVFVAAFAVAAIAVNLINAKRS